MRVHPVTGLIYGGSLSSTLMGGNVYYHLPENKRFSLDFANPDLKTVEERAADYDCETTIREYDLDEAVYALYSPSSELGTADSLDYDFEEEFEQMTDHHQTITARYLRLFETILERLFEEEEERLQAYKQVELEGIPQALSHVDWTGSVPEVGGEPPL